MKYNVISSSSSGNAIIVEDILMLDCGLSYSKIKKYLNKVKLIFISHVHQDHLLPSTIKQLSYNYPTIKFIVGSEDVVKKLVECNVNKKNIYVLKNGIKYDLGLVKVRLIDLYHDVENYGLKWEINSKKGIYATDTNKIDHIVAEDYDLYLIESNYNEELLEKHIQETDDENMIYYLNRAKNTHLSDKKATDFLLQNMGQNSEFVRIHKSSYNYEEID